jgi:hypothetical protein
MSIKKYLISTIAAGSLLMASSAMAGNLQLVNDTGLSGVTVSCTPGNSHPALFGTFDWKLVQTIFFPGVTQTRCTFAANGTTIGTGNIDISNPDAANVTGSAVPPHSVIISGNQTSTVSVTLK